MVVATLWTDTANRFTVESALVVPVVNDFRAFFMDLISSSHSTTARRDCSIASRAELSFSVMIPLWYFYLYYCLRRRRQATAAVEVLRYLAAEMAMFMLFMWSAAASPHWKSTPDTTGQSVLVFIFSTVVCQIDRNVRVEWRCVGVVTTTDPPANPDLTRGNKFFPPNPWIQKGFRTFWGSHPKGFCIFILLASASAPPSRSLARHRAQCQQ